MTTTNHNDIEENWEKKFEKGYKKAIIENNYSDKEEFDEWKDGYALNWSLEFIRELLSHHTEALIQGLEEMKLTPQEAEPMRYMDVYEAFEAQKKMSIAFIKANK